MSGPPEMLEGHQEGRGQAWDREPRIGSAVSKATRGIWFGGQSGWGTEATRNS